MSWHIPDSLVSDNGPAFASNEFKKFESQWEFQHITTCPHYPQSNGKAESAVKICKTLLKKARLAYILHCRTNEIYPQTLLKPEIPQHIPTKLKAGQCRQEKHYYRTTKTLVPLTPVQRLFGRRTRTLLPLSATLLKPEIPQHIPTKLKAGQCRQEKHYYRTTKTLVPLNKGDSVNIRLPGSMTWSQGICRKQVAPRSYLVECKGAC